MPYRLPFSRHHHCIGLVGDVPQAVRKDAGAPRERPYDSAPLLTCGPEGPGSRAVHPPSQ
jgi:hypothetical protein